jgi:outer membrane protein OmpA-like peptidoglycan-associated protein
MKRIWVLFVIFTIAFLCFRTGSAAAEKPTASDWLQSGIELEKSNVHEEAIKMYTEAIRLDRYYAEAYFRRGKAYMAANKTSVMEALQDFNRAIDLDPKNAELYYERGLLNAFSINNENARTDMQTAAGLGHKGAQQWLAPDRRKKTGEAERPQTAVVSVFAPSAVEAEQSRGAGTEEKAGKETGDAFFAPGKRLPSGSEPVVLFDHDKADIREEFRPILDEIAQVLLEKTPDVILVLAGHTDNTGTEKYNDGLAVRRATAVESYLTAERGIPPNRLIVKGYGEGAPIATNDTAEGRAKNRRVEILDAGKSGEQPPAEGR